MEKKALARDLATPPAVAFSGSCALPTPTPPPPFLIMSEARRSTRVRTPSARLVSAAAGEFLSSDGLLVDLHLAMARNRSNIRPPKRRIIELEDADDHDGHTAEGAAFGDQPPPPAPLTPPARVPEFQDSSRDSLPPAPPSPEPLCFHLRFPLVCGFGLLGWLGFHASTLYR